MILSFSKDSFVGLIKNESKVHTIRADKYNRWKPGMSIQFWRGSPRNKSKNPYQFGAGVVSDVRKIIIDPENNTIEIGSTQGMISYHGIFLNSIAKNDGFKNWQEMKEFFPTYFEGKIIFWKEFKEFSKPII